MPYLESLRVFVRVVELGSITSGGRDLRLTPAVASNRVKELERRLGVRLFNRTTRKLTPTEIGKAFYEHARKAVDTIEDAEAVVAGFSDRPRGAIRVTAPLGVGRRLIAPLVPVFAENYPDVAFFVGEPVESELKLRKIMDCPRLLCAAPSYIARHGQPASPDDLLDGGHNCLLLRYPRSPEYFWVLTTPDGPRKLQVAGRYDADDGDVLTGWALDGRGIVNKPRFDVARHLAEGALVEVLPETPPASATFGCLYPHRRLQDPKVRLFVDFMGRECRKVLEGSGI